MKKLSVIFLWSAVAMATAPYTVSVNLASYNLGTAYSTSFPQLALSGLKWVQHLSLSNTSATKICCDTVTLSASTAPTSPDSSEVCVQPGTVAWWDNINIVGNIYCRSTSGTIAAGSLDVEVW